MAAINKVTLQGKLGKEPRWGATPAGALAVRLVVATTVIEEDETSGQEVRSTEWHRAVLEGRLAEQVRHGVSKGDEVFIEGRLKTRRWTDRHGIVRYCTEILADAVQVFPKQSAQCATIPHDALVEWVASYDAATAREVAVEAAKVAVRRRRAAAIGRSAPHTYH